MNSAPGAGMWHRRRLIRAACTVAMVAVCVFTQVGSAVFAGYRSEGITDQSVADAAEMPTAYGLLMMLGIAVAVLLVWRRRWSLWISLGVCLLTVLLPLDALTPLFALYAVVVVRDDRWTWIAVAVTWVAEFASVWRDSRGGQVSSWTRGLTSTPDSASFPWWLVLIVSLVLVACAVAPALLVRSRRALSVTETKLGHRESTLHAMGEEIARQNERERIAREVHDALGHRLSLLSLHASGLELASDDPTLQRSAALVRAGAQESMKDLQSLLAVLRQPQDPDISANVPTLRDLPALIDESLAAGSPVAAAVFVDQSVQLEEPIGRSAYRITQELLTNARKHAPGVPVRLQIEADPDRGVEISTANRLPDGARPVVQPGNGLTGMHERVEQVGGRSWVWIDDEGTFRTLVRLPWHWDPDTATRSHA